MGKPRKYSVLNLSLILTLNLISLVNTGPEGLSFQLSLTREGKVRTQNSGKEICSSVEEVCITEMIS